MVDPMTHEHLLDYALGQLEGPSHAQAEAAIAADPALSARLDRLGRGLGLLLDDGGAHEPPAGLAARTVASVAERKGRRAILDFVPSRVPFRWADVAVAAGVLLAGLLTLVPALHASRDRMSQAGCTFNLQQLGQGLAGYGIRHQEYPDVSEVGAKAPVGVYAMKLNDEELVRDPRAFHCPCQGDCPAVGRELDPNHIDYAYHIGFRPDSSAKAKPVTPWLAGIIPLLADQPPHAPGHEGVVLAGNSPNHGRRGQNVLFSDFHVEFHPSRKISPVDSDLYLNDQARPEPGLGVQDAVLVHPRSHVLAH